MFVGKVSLNKSLITSELSNGKVSHWKVLKNSTLTNNLPRGLSRSSNRLAALLEAD